MFDTEIAGMDATETLTSLASTSTRLDDSTLEWTTRHGLKFLVDHQGTHPVNRQ